MFKNMKIRTKLGLSFGFMMLAVLGVFLVGIININRVNTQYNQMLEYPNQRIQDTLRIPTEVANLRRLITTVAFRTGQLDFIPGLESDLNAVHASLTSIIRDLTNNINDDPDIYGQVLDSYIANFQRLQNLIDSYMTDIVAPTLVAARANDVETVLSFGQAGGPVVAQMTQIYSAMLEQGRTYISDISTDMYNVAVSRAILLIAFFVIGGAVGTAIFIMTARSINKPIKNVVAALEEVANGNLGVNIKVDSADETGMLSRSTQNLVNTLKSLIDDLSRVNHNFNILGNTDCRIDANNYNNSFREVAMNVNALVDEHDNDTSVAIHVLRQLSQGNFSIHIADMPGNKMSLPTALREVTGNLKDVYEAVSYLADNVAEGDFDASVDVSKFGGGWSELLTKLNDLVHSVATPLKELEDNLELMVHGDFSPLTAQMKGEFDTVKTMINTVNEITESQIDEIADILGRMAKGDLTPTITKEYKGSYAPIKTALITILDSLNETMKDISSAVEQVALGADQVSITAQHLAEGTSRQSSALDDLSNSVNLINEKAKQANDSANAASQSTKQSKEYAEEGGEAVQTMADTMNRIKNSSENISKIIDVITNIAFQTNLLALNASVEAARAGEQGKGFSVVADEVRTLAGRSQRSASDTTSIIEEDNKNVAAGMESAAQVVKSFESIASNIDEIANLVVDIADISGKQLESITNINVSLSEITTVVTETSATAEESSAASEELNSMSDMLRQKVAFFKMR